MVRKIIFKNTSNNKNQIKNITIPIFTTEDLAPILVGRTENMCKYDVKISKEEILLVLRPYLENYTDTNSTPIVKTANIIDDLIVGDTKRFILIEYEADENNIIERTEKLFREQFVGMTKNAQYSNIRVNSTNNKFLNTKFAINNNSIIKSVCTDGAYINSVSNYIIQVSQRMYNKTVDDFLDDFDIKYVDSNLNNNSIQRFNNLYIPAILEDGYRLHANFFGVNNDTLSNRFWVLPNEFKKNGLTYEIFNSEDGINLSDPSGVLKSYNDFINNVLSFSVSNNILTIKYDDSEIPKTQMFIPTDTEVVFTQFDTNDEVKIKNPVTLDTANFLSSVLYKPSSSSILSDPPVNKTIASLTSDKIFFEDGCYIDNPHDIDNARPWKALVLAPSHKKIKMRAIQSGKYLKYNWPSDDDGDRFFENLTILDTGITYNFSNFETNFGVATEADFEIFKVTRNTVFIRANSTPTITLSFNNPVKNNHGNHYFASYQSETETSDNSAYLKAGGSGNMYDISIVSADGVEKSQNMPMSFDDTITINRFDISGNIISSFNFKNNFIDGIVGYYHELDNTKTIKNNTGFYDTDIATSKENVGVFIEQFVNIKWFSNILSDALNNPSIYNTGFVNIIDTARTGPFSSTDGRFYFNMKSISSTNFSNFTFENVTFKTPSTTLIIGTVFSGCLFNNCKMLSCDFGGCKFESMSFNNIYSKNCLFENFIDSKRTDNSPMPKNHTFYNGKIITKDFSNNNIDYTTLTFRDFDGSYNDKITALNQRQPDTNIRNFIDLSSSRVDYYNLRSLMKVETGYQFDISLTQILLNGFNNFTTEKDKDNFYLNNSLAIKEKAVEKYSPYCNENLERNLDTPVMFLIYEDDEQLSRKSLQHYFNIEIDSPDDMDVSFIKKADIYPSDKSKETTVLTIYFNDLIGKDSSNNRIDDVNFYEHQFQNDLYNKNAHKLCGIHSILTTDYKHNGNWQILKHPYNSINNDDTISCYPKQVLNTTNTPLNTSSGGQVSPISSGPLSYYQLDISFTDKILSDFPSQPDNSVAWFSRSSSLRIRKANPNYEYIESSTENSRINALKNGNQNINHRVTSFYDLSFGQPNNPVDYQLLDITY